MELVSASDADALARVTTALDTGELVVVPGDLRYLVAADALDDAAVERLFLAKGRGADRALTVLLGGAEDIHHVAFGGPSIRDAAEACWPGATSIVLRARPWVPEAVIAGGDGLALSVPANEFTRALAKRFGPIAVASARRSGGADPLAVMDAQKALGAEVARYVDGGILPGGEAKKIRGGELVPE